MNKRNLFLFLALSIFLTLSASSQSSFYLGKTISFIKQEKGQPSETEYKNGQTIYVYKKTSQKGVISYTMYHFDSNSKCVTITQDFEMWFIIPWTDELSQKYKRLDKYNWLEKTNIIHAVQVINDDKWIYIIKYKDS